MRTSPDSLGNAKKFRLSAGFCKKLKGRAFAWLIKLRNKEAVWAEVRQQIEEFLRERQATEDHIRQQVERAQILFGPWLSGLEGEE